MGKAKKYTKAHDAALDRLASLLVEAASMAEDGPLTACEVVGNLELAKQMVIDDAMGLADALREEV